MAAVSRKKNASTNPFEENEGDRGGQQQRRHDVVLPSTSLVSIDNQSSSVGLNRLASASPTFSRNPFDGPNRHGDSPDYDDDMATTYTAGSAYTHNNNPVGGGPTSAAQQQQPPAEASWQYLGDLPYRRIPIYTNIVWHRNRENSDDIMMVDGLSCVPTSALPATSHRLSLWEMQQLVATTTRTLVVGCPHGGPIAAVTVPTAPNKGGSSAGSGTAWTKSEIKIMTNSGAELSRIEFPPPLPAAGDGGDDYYDEMPWLRQHKSASSYYAPSDLVTMGFTSRTLLVLVLRDTTVLVYNVQGQRVLPPFALIPPPNDAESHSAATSDAAVHVVQGTVYENGVAVLLSNQASAIAELLDDRDGVDHVQDYLRTASTSSRIVTAGGAGGSGGVAAPASSSSKRHHDSRYSALVTVLPTLAHSRLHHCKYVALCVLPGIRTSTGHPDVLLSTSDNSVVVVNAATLDVTDVNCRTRLASPIVQMSVAPNGRFLAAFTESQILTVVSTTFETKVLDFDTSEGSSAPPTQLCWCGEDCVMLHWRSLGVLLIGPYGDWVRCAYNESYSQIYLLPDMDGCRVVTESAVELLQRVPPTTANLLRIGSIEPSAMLLDASDAFFHHTASGQSGRRKDDPTYRDMDDNDHDDPHRPQSVPAASSYMSAEEAAAAIVKTGMLYEAIEACTEAACREFDIVTQKRLLRAASYGMHFGYKNAGDEKRLVMGGPGTTRGAADDFDPNAATAVLPSPTSVKFVQTSRKLRVLNALRHPRVGFVLTSAQYDAITPAGVIARLVENFSRPALAVAIARYLNLPKSVQLYARAAQASALVATLSSSTRSGKPLSDSEIAEAAIRVINNEDGDIEMAQSNASLSASATLAMAGHHRGGYATVAMAANRTGRKGVANLLLMLETSVADKVPALISTGAFADAVAVATAARDSDFIFSTLMEYEKVCISSTTDMSKAQATYLSTVVSKFTPEAFHMLRRYLGTTADVKSVTNLLVRAQKYTDAGSAIALRALGERDIREKQGVLAEASRIFALGKDTTIYKSCTDDYLELLKDQEVVRTKYGTNDILPVEASVSGLISSLLRYAATNVREQHRLLSDADKIAKKFRVSDKRLWYIKVKAFSESNQWSNLRILADSKKSPIGYKPFARAAIRGKQSTEEILRYVDRVTAPEEKYDLYCEAGLWNKALDEASRMRDVRRVLNVKSLCNSPDLQLHADQVMATLAER